MMKSTLLKPMMQRRGSGRRVYSAKWTRSANAEHRDFSRGFYPHWSDEERPPLIEVGVLRLDERGFGRAGKELPVCLNVHVSRIDGGYRFMVNQFLKKNLRLGCTATITTSWPVTAAAVRYLQFSGSGAGLWPGSPMDAWVWQGAAFRSRQMAHGCSQCTPNARKLRTVDHCLQVLIIQQPLTFNITLRAILFL